MRLLKIMWKCWLAELAARIFTMLSGIGTCIFWIFSMERMNFWYLILSFVCCSLVGIGIFLGNMLHAWEKNLRKEYEKMLDNPKEL